MPGEPGKIQKLDEAVVNRIAAGEVIQRPCNAIKEMLENSLDAGSTNITVTALGGGLKKLIIKDNGTGIRKEDLQIVAERFTTSKLKQVDDLLKIATHGFRGEALASISHVAHLSILTKTSDAQCGFICEYKDSKLISGVKPQAANQGTTITVEDLFYNVPIRRAALRSEGEEHRRITEVVMKYAIHNSGVAAFTMKKLGEVKPDVITSIENDVIDNIRIIYGSEIAKELVDIELSDGKLKFRLSGKISRVNYNNKKMVFLLFINHRLVESKSIKKAIENVYASYLPKGSHPFIYFSLHIDPQNVDVNVHPTKHEVFFLNEEDIVEKIQRGLEEQLLNSNASRTFATKKLVNDGAGTTLEMFEKTLKSAAPAAKDMIRTDCNLQKIEKFLSRKDKSDHQNEPSNNSVESSTAAPPRKDKVTEATEEELDSIRDLKEQILSEASRDTRKILDEATFVGCVDRELALVQFETKLLIVNITRLSSLFFKQMIIRQFRKCDEIKLNPPAPVAELVQAALDLEDSGWTENAGEKSELVKKAVEFLSEDLRREMLAEFFSLKLDIVEGELCLVTLPLLLEDFCPWYGGLPIFMLRLWKQVNWNEEIKCIESFSEEIAAFYSVGEFTGRKPVYNMLQHGDDGVSWEHTVEHILFPAIRKLLVPPSECERDRTLVQVASLPELYKVFERC